MSRTKVMVSGDVLALLLDLPDGFTIDSIDRIPPRDEHAPVQWGMTIDVSDKAANAVFDGYAPSKADLVYETQPTTAPVLVEVRPL